MIVSTEIDELPDLLRQRGKQGYDILYNKYAASLYGIIFRAVNNAALAESLLEKSMLKICEDICQYDKNKTGFFTWISNIARVIVRDGLNKSQNVTNTLPHEDCPEVLRHIFWHGLSADETARILNISVSEVKACLRNELKKANTSVK